MIRAALLPLATVVLVGCNAYGPQPMGPAGVSQGPRQCFYASNVAGFRQGPAGIVYVNTNARDYYALETLDYCVARLDFEHRIALRSRSGGFICTGMDAEIYVPDALGSTYCPVRSVRKLSPSEVTALRSAPRRQR